MPIGAQVSSAGGILAALDRGVEMGAEAVQFFAHNPRAFAVNPLPVDRVAAFVELAPTSSVRAVFCHAPYLINMATDRDDLALRSESCLLGNLESATLIGADGLVLHVGSHLGAGFDSILDTVSRRLVRVLDVVANRLGRQQCRLLLENAAGAGGTIGRTLEELARVIERCGEDERLGVCLDTQHLFASGVTYTTKSEAAVVVEELDRVVGLERLGCIHLNDSLVPLGANRDRHANVGEGEIGADALGLLVGHPAFNGVPVILEVPGEGNGPRRKDVEVAKGIVADGAGHWLATSPHPTTIRRRR